MTQEAKPKIRKQVINNQVFFQELRTRINEGRQVRIRAKGWSMLPLIWDDRDVIVLGPLTERSIQVGRIVLAQLGTGRYVVHRITAIKGSRLTLRGDGNPYQEEYVHVDKVLGELVKVTRDGQDYSPQDIQWRLTTWLWPSHGFLRRVILFFYRRLVVRPSTNKPRRYSSQ